MEDLRKLKMIMNTSKGSDKLNDCDLNDNLPLYRQGREEDDVVDSDFDIDENDELISDGESADKPKRPKRLVTRAYKEPKPSKSSPRKKTVKFEKRKRDDDESDEEEEEEEEPQEKRVSSSKSPVKKRKTVVYDEDEDSDDSLFIPKPYDPSSEPKSGTSKSSMGEDKAKKDITKSPSASYSPIRKAVRSSTTLKSVETKKRVQERQKIEEKRKEQWRERQVEEVKYTQEELLEEAKITEKINLEFLGKLIESFF